MGDALGGSYCCAAMRLSRANCSKEQVDTRQSVNYTALGMLKFVGSFNRLRLKTGSIFRNHLAQDLAPRSFVKASHFSDKNNYSYIGAAGFLFDLV